MLCCGDHNEDPQDKEHQEVKKCDINLDTIFQIADEVMQTPSNSCLVRVETPEKPGSVLVVPSNPHSSMPCDLPDGTIKANVVCEGPIILAVSGSDGLGTYEQKGESVVSVSEQMPEDPIFEVNSDDAKDSDIIAVEITDALRETSQAYNRSCTESTESL